MSKKYTALAIFVSISFFGIGMFTMAVLQEMQRKPDAPAIPVKPEKPVAANTEDLWLLTNDERTKSGLQPLERSPALDASAAAKCADMQAKKYFAHTTPSGVRFEEFIKKEIGYHHAGENLALNTGDAAKTTTSWMASPGHRENILKSDYTLVGYASCEGDEGVIAVQHFARP